MSIGEQKSLASLPFSTLFSNSSKANLQLDSASASQSPSRTFAQPALSVPLTMQDAVASLGSSAAAAGQGAIASCDPSRRQSSAQLSSMAAAAAATSVSAQSTPQHAVRKLLSDGGTSSGTGSGQFNNHSARDAADIPVASKAPALAPAAATSPLHLQTQSQPQSQASRSSPSPQHQLELEAHRNAIGQARAKFFGSSNNNIDTSSAPPAPAEAGAHPQSQPQPLPQAPTQPLVSRDLRLRNSPQSPTKSNPNPTPPNVIQTQQTGSHSPTRASTTGTGSAQQQLSGRHSGTPIDVPISLDDAPSGDNRLSNNHKPTAL